MKDTAIQYDSEFLLSGIVHSVMTLITDHLSRKCNIFVSVLGQGARALSQIWKEGVNFPHLE